MIGGKLLHVFNMIMVIPCGNLGIPKIVYTSSHLFEFCSFASGTWNPKRKIMTQLKLVNKQEIWGKMKNTGLMLHETWSLF